MYSNRKLVANIETVASFHEPPCAPLLVHRARPDPGAASSYSVSVPIPDPYIW